MEKIKTNILVVDDERDMLDTYISILSKHFNVFTSSTGKECLETIKKENIQLVLLDIKMPKQSGIETLKTIKEIDPQTDVIMVTASKEVKSAVECIKLGAYDYVTKPFEVDELTSLIGKVLERRELVRENACLRTIVADSDRFCELIGKSKAMKEIFKLIDDVSSVDSTVLITGESGTGKELTAKAIHKRSKRKNKPFVTVNCAAIPDNLLESELFGFEAGSFTGAYERKLGKFELASGGTIFLDEIGCMSPGMQAKILRALEDKKIDRLGGKISIPVDIRVISATNINFDKAIKEGKFREDLYYRLNVIPIRMPSLRERKEDIPLLIHHFMGKFNKDLNRNISGFTEEAINSLIAHDWPGNVRELQNLIERMVALSKNGRIVLSDLFLQTQQANEAAKDDYHDLERAISSFEKEYINEILEKTGGNQTQAAKILGIHRTTLLSKLKNLSLK